eukprot:gene36147-43841_t
MSFVPLFPFSANRLTTMLRSVMLKQGRNVARVDTSRPFLTRGSIIGVTVLALAVGNQALCAEAGNNKEKNNVTDAAVVSNGSRGEAGAPGGQGGDPLQRLVGHYAGVLQQLGFSGFMGVCSALALKKISRQAAVAVGLAFGGLQLLAYLGYVRVDYQKVNDDAQRALDVTGDGKFDEQDLRVLSGRLTELLQQGLPAAGAFSAGFGLGLYYL